MKILKRLSPHSSIGRATEPTNYTPAIHRYFHNQSYTIELTPEEQLTKYGYTAKPVMSVAQKLLAMSCLLAGITLHIYLYNLYKNEMRTRYRYRVQQKEHSSLLLRMRTIAFEIGYYMESNLFAGEAVFNLKSKKIYRTTEEILRAEQYRNYMRNRDNKFDFMDLGEMERFPFPNFGE